MSNIVLSDNLLKLYFSFTRNCKVDNNESNEMAIEKLNKLLACIKEFYTNPKQLSRCNITDEIFIAVESSIPLFNLDNTTSELNELVAKCKLKLLLVDKLCTDKEIISYNIMTKNTSYGFNYSKTFRPNTDKSFAINHIKQLILNASKVEIVDRYFGNNQFQSNIKLLAQIVTQKNCILEIRCGSSDNSLKQNLSSAGFSNPRLSQLDANIHDRYIKANGVKIHLSSGFDHLNQQDKEITYMVEIL